MTDRIKWASFKRVKEAAEELKGLILAEYPEAEFKLVRDIYQLRSWILCVYLDVGDPEEVRRLTVDREVDMLAEEHIPVHVSVRTPIKPQSRAKPARARKAG